MTYYVTTADGSREVAEAPNFDCAHLAIETAYGEEAELREQELVMLRGATFETAKPHRTARWAPEFGGVVYQENQGAPR